MANRAKWNRNPRSPISTRGRVIAGTGLVLLFALIAFLAGRLLRAPGKGSGPKVIVADGTTYYACGGALWTTNGDATDRTNPLYEVLYVDAQGRQQQIHHVQTLDVRNLDIDSPACHPATSAH